MSQTDNAEHTSEERDPQLQALFAQAYQELPADDFSQQLMIKVNHIFFCVSQEPPEVLRYHNFE